MADTLTQLIAALDTEDARRQRRAGDALLAAGPDALPALARALLHGTPAQRKAASFLLGATRTGSPEVLDALAEALLHDAEPKVRKNVAVSLGRLRAERSVPALEQALAQEVMAWVRPSLILALGAIGGEAAGLALQRVRAQDATESEALRKALDRSGPHQRSARWQREGAARLRLLLETPVGLESVARAEAAAQRIRMGAEVAPGVLRCPPGVAPWELLPALRCAHGLLIEAGEGPALPEDSAGMAAAISDLVARSPLLNNIRSWLASDEPVLRYRFSLTFGVRREALRDLLETVRAACQPLGLEDSPSNYDFELLADTDNRAARLLVRPSFMGDERFAYRERDVGAAINPVVAACLARLGRTGPAATVLDPTCGSATLLIERALLDGDTQLYGLDISPTAMEAAETNIAAAGLRERTSLELAHAADRSYWPPCDEVLANLPFGLRTERHDADLELLYADIADNLTRRLRPGGQAVLYTTRYALLDAALDDNRDLLEVRRHLRVHSGGLSAGVWVVVAR